MKDGNSVVIGFVYLVFIVSSLLIKIYSTRRHDNATSSTIAAEEKWKLLPAIWPARAVSLHGIMGTPMAIAQSGVTGIPRHASLPRFDSHVRLAT